MPVEKLPTNEDVTRRTEQVTKRIQELWTAMQDPTYRDPFVPCADKIRTVVSELIAIFPHVSFTFYLKKEKTFLLKTDFKFFVFRIQLTRT